MYEYTAWKWLANQLGQMQKYGRLRFQQFVHIVPFVYYLVNTRYNVTIPITVSICVHVEIRTENCRQLTRVGTLHYKRLQCVHIPIISLTRDQCQVCRLLFEIDIYDGAYRYGSRVFNHAVGDSSSVDISDRLRRVGIPATTMGHENTARYPR